MKLEVHRRLAAMFGYELIRRKKLGHLTASSHLQRLLHVLDANCVIDGGANHGQYGLQLRQLGFTGRIVSFEPVRATFEALQRKCAGDAAWRCVNAALGARESTLRINVTRGSGFASFLDPSRYGVQRFGDEALAIDAVEDVPVRRLDDMFSEVCEGIAAPRVFLKMDTQGYDLEVFNGAQRVLDRVVGLQSELSLKPIYEGMPDFQEALAAYRSKGFAITGMYPVSRDHASLAVIEYDCLMRKD
jgi:FkbM family methyltransferase